MDELLMENVNQIIDIQHDKIKKLITPYFQNDYLVLFHGDCMNIMKYLQADKIITSPPYNIVRPNSTDRGYDIYKDGMSNERYIEWTVNIFKMYDQVLRKNGAVIYNMSYGTENTEVMNLTVAEILKQTNFTIADILIWKKQTATPNNVSSNKMTRIVEFVYVFCRRDEFQTFTSNKSVIGFRDDTGQKIYENVFNYFEAKNNDISQELNKATFSKEFVQEIIDRYVLKSDIVLDNFSGTGTTIIACAENNIKVIGIELSINQCEYTVRRIKKGIQPKLF